MMPVKLGGGGGPSVDGCAFAWLLIIVGRLR